MDYHKLTLRAAVAALLGGVCAATAAESSAIPAGSDDAGGPEFELSADFCTRQISRGLPDNTDPIVTLAAAASWMGFTAEIDGIFNVTDIAGDDGFDAGDNTEIDAIIGYEHTLAADALGDVTLGADYTYEYDQGGNAESDHVSYLHASVGLDDIPLSPTITGEWMLDGIHGQYYTFELSHTFALSGDADKPDLGLTLSFVQGLGNDKYNAADLGRDSWGLRETTIMAELEWAVSDHLSVTPYAAYSDHINGNFRRPAHFHADEEASHHVAQLYGGVAAALSF